ncbi:hypothetical protein OPIT5_28430 [Opitutaceae bacterium TAV5]|nr:hypothetical protein OPIT5_28430 [Opitutaceae bacterium TAV5]
MIGCSQMPEWHLENAGFFLLVAMNVAKESKNWQERFVRFVILMSNFILSGRLRKKSNCRMYAVFIMER